MWAAHRQATRQAGCQGRKDIGDRAIRRTSGWAPDGGSVPAGRIGGGLGFLIRTGCLDMATSAVSFVQLISFADKPWRCHLRTGANAMLEQCGAISLVVLTVLTNCAKRSTES